MSNEELFFVDKRRRAPIEDEIEDIPQSSKQRRQLSSEVKDDANDEITELSKSKIKASKKERELAFSLFGNATQSNEQAFKSNKELNEKWQEEDEYSDESESEDEPRIETENYVPVWDDEEPEDMVVNIVGKDSKPRFHKLATKEEKAESDAHKEIVHFKGVKMHPKRDTANVSIHTSVLEKRLRDQYRAISKTPTDWAIIDKSKQDIEDEDEAKILRTANKKIPSIATSAEITPLNNTHLRINKLVDANVQKRSQGSIDVIQFHQSGRLLFTAGLDKTISLFQIDGKRNDKIQSTFFQDLSITSATFLGNAFSNSIVAVGHRPFLYLYDINSSKVDKIARLHDRNDRGYNQLCASMDGKFLSILTKPNSPRTNVYTQVILAHQQSLRVYHTFVPSGGGDAVTDSKIALNPSTNDENRIYTLLENGIVNVYDLRKVSQVFHSFHDEGSVKTTSFAITKDGTKIAIGSNAGIVNVYDTNTVLTSPNPTPLKAVGNLTTSIDDLTFSFDGQLLFYSSHEKKESLKAFHVSSLRTYANWPSPSTHLYRVCSHTLSPHGGYLAVGNDHGRAMLFRVCHYNDA